MNHQENQDEGRRPAEEALIGQEVQDLDPMGIEREARLRERSRRGWALLLVGAVLVLGVFLVYWLSPDLAYFFRSTTPSDLGLAEELRNHSLEHNDFVRIRGIARDMCIRAKSSRFMYLLGSELAVRILIETAAGEDQGCLGAEDRGFEGRLLDLSRTGKYDSVVAYYRSHFPAAPRQGTLYLLQDGERPRSEWWSPLVLLVVLILWALNARTLWRMQRFRRSIEAEGGA